MGQDLCGSRPDLRLLGYGRVLLRLVLRRPGGPFPELCEDTNASGAQLASLKQDYWPLRNACIYSDGSTVEHLSMSINVFVYVPAGLAVVLTCAAALLYRRARHIPEEVTS